MAERLEVYRCKVCGHIVLVLNAGRGELACCGQPMEFLREGSVDASQEKHVPVIEKVEGGYKVKVGSTPHAMEEKHYIQWIELQSDNKCCIQFLKPGEAPEAFFRVEAEKVAAREYCNLHGLWKSSED